MTSPLARGEENREQLHKLDPKLKFQNSKFREELKKARGYKRTVLKLPEKEISQFLANIGLGSWKNRIITATALLLAIYIIYIPNLFYIQNITAQGVEATEQSAVQETVRSYFSSHRLWPQKNILLLSKDSLKQEILSKHPEILNISSIKKKFPNKLFITAEAHLDTYLFITPSQKWLIYQDGLAHKDVSFDASTTLPSTLIPLTTEDSLAIQPGQAVVENELLKSINTVVADFTHDLGLPITGITINDTKFFDLTIYTKNGFHVFVDAKSNLDNLSEQTRLLLSQLSPGQQKGLYYIDLRIQNKGFLCFKDAPCVKDYLDIPTTTPTSTLDSTLPSSTISTIK